MLFKLVACLTVCVPFVFSHGDYHRGRDGDYGSPTEYYGAYNYPPRYYDSGLIDTHYCSVHASFALVLSQYNNNRYAYGQSGKENYDQSDPQRSSLTRQFCRYAAVSESSCRVCCKIAARSASTSQDEIVAAIFSFDPVNPTANGAGYSPTAGHADNYYYQSRKKRDLSVGMPIKQCVCCAPKRDY